MTRILLFLLLALGATAGTVAQTATVPAAPSVAPASPYSATVPVAGTSDVQRSAAISAALEQVLLQVSPGFVVTPEVLAQASGDVRDYHYRRAASGGLEMQVDFDPGAISRLIVQAQSAAGGAIAGQPGAAASTAAAVMAQGGTGTLWVDGVENSHAFASLLSALRSDSSLQDVVPVAAEGDGVMFRVTSDQPLAAALASLTGPAGHLAPAAQPHPGADTTARWIP